MADKPTPPTATPSTFAGVSLPSWAVTLLVTIIISAGASWGSFQYARGQSERELDKKFSTLEKSISDLSTQVNANAEYIKGEKDRKDQELNEFLRKRNEYADQMGELLQQYKRAAPPTK